MTATPEQLDRVARLNEGDLAEVPFAVLLYALARSRRTIAVEISRGPLQKVVSLEDGVPVDCRSNLVTETLSRFMVSGGYLSTAAADTVFRESVARSLRFGEVLIEKGLFTAEELLRILQQNLAHKLLDPFSWREGGFRMSAELAPTDVPLKVNVPQLILIGVTRFATQQQIDASVAPLIGTPLALNSQPPLAVAELRLPAGPAALLDALRDHPLRIDELATVLGMTFGELTRHLHALTLIEMVVPADRLPCAARPPLQQAAASAPAPTSGPAAGAKTSGRRRNELMELALNHRRKDPCELLGVDPERVAATVHARFLAFAERYAPWSFEPELAEPAREVFLAGVRAYVRLCEPARRPQAAAGRPRPEAPPARDAYRVSTELLDPEQQFRAGMELAAAGRFKRALEQLEYAVDLDPQNLAYRCELANCRYHANPEANVIRALEELREVTRIDPGFGLALYSIGDILRRAGSLDDAEVFLKRSVKPLAPDRRPIEALKALNRQRRAQD
jgi:tetratricopeptide (TPR) repeat protein